jgi:hypothetical protein
MRSGTPDDGKGAVLYRKEYFLLLWHGSRSIRESVSAKGQGNLRPSEWRIAMGTIV